MFCFLTICRHLVQDPEYGQLALWNQRIPESFVFYSPENDIIWTSQIIFNKPLLTLRDIYNSRVVRAL